MVVDGFRDVMATFQQIGVYDVLLPFVLIFTISFAVLQKIQLFGRDKKNINAVISFVTALLFLQNTYLIFVLQKFLPNVGIILVIFLMFLLIFGIFSGPRKFTGSSLGLAFIVALGAIIWALVADMFYPGPYGYGGGLLDLYYSVDPGTMTMLWFIVLAALFIWFVTSGDRRGQGFGKKFKDMIDTITEDTGRE